MNRRDFLKTLGLGMTAIALNRKMSSAEPASVIYPCKIVVFGADGLRIDSAQAMRAQGAPALSSLYSPICSLNGGLSMTQPGWASIWTGMPSVYTGTYRNKKYSALPPGGHILGRIMDKFLGKDFYAVWIHGKRDNIRGNIPESPHYQVYDRIVNKNYPGVYYGEEVGLNDPLVYRLATEALTEASLHENFCCFVQFGNPDNAGHRYEDYNKYLEYAFRVDEAIYDLMQLLPDDTDIIYCSDHGFNFKSLGEIENSHMFAPKGMLTTNFPTLQTPYVCQHSIGRLIYTRSGGDPNHVDLASGTYSMYGTDLTDDLS